MDKKIYYAIFFIVVSILVSTFGIYIIYFSDVKQSDGNEETTTTEIITTTYIPEIESTTTTTDSNGDETTTTTTSEITTTTKKESTDKKTTTKKTTTKKTTTKKTTTKKTTTKKTTTSTTTTKSTSKTTKTTKRYALKIEEKTEESSEYKYGTKITTIKYYEVTTYSDGDVEKELIKTKVEYDKSSFDADTSQLLSEAKSLANSNKSTYNLVVSYVNDYRRDAGVGDITLNNELSVLATVRALELAWSGGVYDISHTRPDGSKWSTVLKDMNYSYSQAGENIAAGYNSVKSVCEAWKGSSGHYANMVRGGFNQIGVGLAIVDGVRYWVQIFSD